MGSHIWADVRHRSSGFHTFKEQSKNKLNCLVKCIILLKGERKRV